MTRSGRCRRIEGEGERPVAGDAGDLRQQRRRQRLADGLRAEEGEQRLRLVEERAQIGRQRQARDERHCQPIKRIQNRTQSRQAQVEDGARRQHRFRAADGERALGQRHGAILGETAGDEQECDQQAHDGTSGRGP